MPTDWRSLASPSGLQIQLLWFRKTVGVVMHVYADRERGHLEFKLARKGVMRAFHGKWHIRPHEPTEGEVAAWVARNKIEAPPGSSWCLATLQQDVMPAGIPPFMANIPGIR